MITFAVVGALGLVLLAVSVVFDDFLEGAGPEWLTGVSIGAAGAVFGLVGIFGSSQDWPAWLSTTGAVVGAAAAAVGANAVGLGIMKGASSRAMTSQDLVGQQGTSILGARAGSAGEVLLLVDGNSVKVNGRCDQDLKPGDRVEVTSASSITSVAVRKIP